MKYTITYVICTGSTCASMCNTMLQQLHEMPNLSHTCSTLGMDQFIELFEWYLEFKDYLSNPETYTMAVFWNS